MVIIYYFISDIQPPVLSNNGDNPRNKPEDLYVLSRRTAGPSMTHFDDDALLDNIVDEHNKMVTENSILYEEDTDSESEYTSDN